MNGRPTQPKMSPIRARLLISAHGIFQVKPTSNARITSNVTIVMPKVCGWDSAIKPADIALKMRYFLPSFALRKK
jgi:hypothetical protein